MKRRASRGRPPRNALRGVIANLPEDQLLQVIEWLAAGKTYAAVQSRMREDFGATISQQGISEFYRKNFPPAPTDREVLIKRAVAEAQNRHAESADSEGAK